MIKFDAEKPVHFCDGMKRRDFLHAGSRAASVAKKPTSYEFLGAGVVALLGSCVMLQLKGLAAGFHLGRQHKRLSRRLL